MYYNMLHHENKPMSCIIIDDEPHALEAMSQLTAKIPLLNLLGSYTSVEDGLAFLQKNGTVNIVFSDINMPENDGISAGKLLRQHSQFLVYITGYREHALDAFGVGADAYLLKPLDYVTLLTKVGEFHDKISNRPVYGEEVDWLFVKGEQRNSQKKLKKTEIVYVQAMGNYIQIFTSHNKYITHMQLNKASMRLSGYFFVQINKSTLISLCYLDQINGKRVVLTAGEVREHSVGKPYEEEFRRIVSLYQ